MDPVNIFKSILGSIWRIIPALVLVSILKTAWFKGKWGEFFVRVLMWVHLPKDKYSVIHNVTLPSDEGTTQIDHVVVSRYGVFVVETKNMRGWIFGGVDQSHWTQKIFKSSHRFQNPLRQNYKHTKTLETILGIPSEAIFSVIVFTGDSTFKTAMPPNVTYARGCTDFIRQKTKTVLTVAQVDSVCRSIEGGMLKRGFKTDRQHVEHVKTIIQNKSRR